MDRCGLWSNDINVYHNNIYVHIPGGPNKAIIINKIPLAALKKLYYIPTNVRFKGWYCFDVKPTTT